MSARRRIVGSVGVLVLAVVASVAPITTVPASAAKSDCPVKALDRARDKPVEIVMWHSMAQANEQTLQSLADRFNASQGDVRVRLLNTTSYADTFTKYRAGLTSGDLPDIVQLEDTALQAMIDSRSVVPTSACVKADRYNTNDFVERVLDYYSVDGTLYGMPFNVSNPVLYYNKQAFQKAGLDPDDPPKTLADVRDAAQQLVDTGTTKSGFAIQLHPWYLEQWQSQAGKTYVDNANGRTRRATGVTFDNAVGREVYTWLDGMVDDGLAPSSLADQSSFDNLLALGTGNAAMTIDTSARLGSVLQVLGSGQFPNVTVGVGPMPRASGKGASGKGGIAVGGAALYIPEHGSPEKRAAAWEFIKFLNEPANQATWSVGTGYVPIRKSALDEPTLQAAWLRTPGYKVAYDQLVTGANNVATAGPVIGPSREVRDAVVNSMTRMLTGGLAPKQALTDAASDADDEIAAYNARVG